MYYVKIEWVTLDDRLEVAIVGSWVNTGNVVTMHKSVIIEFFS